MTRINPSNGAIYSENPVQDRQSHVPADHHSQFSDSDFLKELKSRPQVISGGLVVPSLNELSRIIGADGESINVLCFTWNINGRADDALHRLNALFAKVPALERPSVIAIALQELPPSTLKFHSHFVEVIGEVLKSTHRCYCWVRKWSQMLIIFVNKRLSIFTSHPEYKFVTCGNFGTFAKPFRTKGAIGICFRLLQTSCLFISCHLTHKRLQNRILDYHKISRVFNLSSFPSQSVRIQSDDAANVFWFGDLNFRVSEIEELKELRTKLANRIFRRYFDYRKILIYDELNLEREKGLLFAGFKEGQIKFPPTHKFHVGSNTYTENRIPSYTDRVLYWSKVSDALVPVRYDSIWDLNISDHKPVYCTFRMRVINNKINCCN